jgi:hypothetical protein
MCRNGKGDVVHRLDDIFAHLIFTGEMFGMDSGHGSASFAEKVIFISLPQKNRKVI